MIPRTDVPDGRCALCHRAIVPEDLMRCDRCARAVCPDCRAIDDDCTTACLTCLGPLRPATDAELDDEAARAHHLAPDPDTPATQPSRHESMRRLMEAERRYTHRPPHGDQADRYENIRHAAKNLAVHILDACPASRERTVALDHLDAAAMFANAAIARNE